MVPDMENSGKEISGGKVAPLEPLQAMRLAWGFYRLGLGIALALLLGGGAIKIIALEQLPLPSFMLGLALMLWGLFAFWPPDQLTPQWSRITRRTIGVGVLLMYFAPFVYWWVHQNHMLYLTINMLCFCACIIGLLICIGQLAAETGAYCKDEMFRIESQVSSWAALILLGLPLLLALGFGIHFFLRHQDDPFSQLQKIYLEAPVWIRTFFIIPAAMTILTTFKAGNKFFKIADTR